MADDFDTWREGEPDIEPGGDGTFDDWYEGQPLTGPEESGATTTTSSTTSTTSSTTSSSSTTTTTTDSSNLYEEDFESETIGNAPSNWTERWHTSEAELEVVASVHTGTKAVWIDGSSAGDKYFASYDAWGTQNDQEILCLVRPAYYSVVWGFGFGVRVSGATEATGNGYFFRVWSSNRTYLYKVVNGTWTSLGYTTQDGMYNANDYVWVRLSAVGTAIKVKVWSYGSSEPGSWTKEATDSDISSAGWLGMMQDNASWFNSKIEYLAVDTGGNTIPMPSLSTTSTSTSTTTTSSTTSTTTTSSSTTTTTGTYTTTTFTGTTTTTTAPPSTGQNNNVLIIVATC